MAALDFTVFGLWEGLPEFISHLLEIGDRPLVVTDKKMHIRIQLPTLGIAQISSPVNHFVGHIEFLLSAQSGQSGV
jgi:hypothetical protein